MYDVYLNGRNGLLVVPNGNSIPPDLNGNWRKKKRAVRSVSETIREDVQSQGYHLRSLVGLPDAPVQGGKVCAPEGLTEMRPHIVVKRDGNNRKSRKINTLGI